MILNKNKYVIGLIVALLVIGVVLLIVQNIKTPFRDVTNFEECKEVTGLVLESYPEQCVYKGKTFTNPDQHVDVPNDGNLKTYTDSVNGFNLSFPSNVFTQTNTSVELPFLKNNRTATGIALTHKINVQHCGLSGLPEHCTPTTTDIQLDIVVPNVAFNGFDAGVIGLVTDSEVGPNGTKTVTQGVEGEGITYFLVPLANGGVLVIGEHFIDESIVAGYKNTPGFIPYDEQKNITAQILNSITVAKTDGYTYENNKYNFSLYLPMGYKGYTVNEYSNSGIQGVIKSYGFAVDTKGVDWGGNPFEVFRLLIYPRVWWDTNAEVDQLNQAWIKNKPQGLDTSLGGFISKNNSYSFTWVKGQDCPPRLPDYSRDSVQCHLYETAEDVAKTLKFIK